MPTLELETMRCVVDGSLGRLHLNRPEALNAANWAWVRHLVQAVDFLKEHTEVHIVIVSGEGRSFCSGLDVKELSEGNLSLEWFEVWEQGVSALANLPAITIAAIQGYCLGGGLQLAVACDLLVASTDAVFSIPAVKEGVVADLGPMRLARLIGSSKAKYLCLLGRRFSAKEGLEMGILRFFLAKREQRTGHPLPWHGIDENRKRRGAAPERDNQPIRRKRGEMQSSTRASVLFIAITPPFGF